MPAWHVREVWTNVAIREIELRLSPGDTVDLEGIEDRWEKFKAKKAYSYSKGKVNSPTAAERQEYLGDLDPRLDGFWSGDRGTNIVGDYFTATFEGRAYLGAPSGRSSPSVEVEVEVDGEKISKEITLHRGGRSDDWEVRRGADGNRLDSSHVFLGATIDRYVDLTIVVSFEAREVTDIESIKLSATVEGHSQVSATSIDTEAVAGGVDVVIKEPLRLEVVPDPPAVTHGAASQGELVLTNLSPRRRLTWMRSQLGESLSATPGVLNPGEAATVYESAAFHDAPPHGGLDAAAVTFTPAQLFDVSLPLEHGDSWRRVTFAAAPTPVACIGLELEPGETDPLPAEPANYSMPPAEADRSLPLCMDGRLLGLRRLEIDHSAWVRSGSAPSLSVSWGPAPRPDLVVSDWVVWDVTLELGLGFGRTIIGKGGTATLAIEISEDGEGGLRWSDTFDFEWEGGFEIFENWEIVGMGGERFSEPMDLGFFAGRSSVVTLRLGLGFQAREVGEGTLRGKVSLNGFESFLLDSTEVAIEGRDGIAPFAVGDPVELRLSASESISHEQVAMATLEVVNTTDAAEVRWEEVDLRGRVVRPGLCAPGGSTIAAWRLAAHDEDPHPDTQADAVVFAPAALVDVRVPLDSCEKMGFDWWRREQIDHAPATVECRGVPAEPVPSPDTMPDEPRDAVTPLGTISVPARSAGESWTDELPNPAPLFEVTEQYLVGRSIKLEEAGGLSVGQAVAFGSMVLTLTMGDGTTRSIPVPDDFYVTGHDPQGEVDVHGLRRWLGIPPGKGFRPEMVSEGVDLGPVTRGSPELVGNPAGGSGADRRKVLLLALIGLFLLVAVVGGIVALAGGGGDSAGPEPTTPIPAPLQPTENDTDPGPLTPEPAPLQPTEDEQAPDPPTGEARTTWPLAVIPLGLVGDAPSSLVLVADSAGGLSWSIVGTPGVDSPSSSIDESAAFLASVGGDIIERWFGNTSFPCGAETPDYRVTCPLGAGTVAAGEYIVVVSDHAGAIADGPGQHTYGLAFDDDGDDSDNYQFTPPFDADFFRNTEYWYRLEIDADGTRRVWADGIEGGILGYPRFSSAAVIEVGNSIVWVVPRTEVPGDQLAFRTTAFHNEGDPNVVPDPANSGGDVLGSGVDGSLFPIDISPVIIDEIGAIPPDVDAPIPRIDVPAGTEDAHLARVLIQEFADRANARLAAGDRDEIIALLVPGLLQGPGEELCRTTMESTIALADSIAVTATPNGPVAVGPFAAYQPTLDINYPTGTVAFQPLLTPGPGGRLHLILAECLT